MGQCIQIIPCISTFPDTYLSDSFPGILGQNIQLIPRKLHKWKFILGLESFVFTPLLWNKIPWMTFSSPWQNDCYCISSFQVVFDDQCAKDISSLTKRRWHIITILLLNQYVATNQHQGFFVLGRVIFSICQSLTPKGTIVFVFQ